jgi:DNA-binding CsgD family transcriptional regulator
VELRLARRARAEAGEQKLFCRLSVFAGGWTLEAAEAVGAGEDIEWDEVLDLLSTLVDKSLVVVTPGESTTRYGMLEPVRQYGKERLEESGEADATRGRHAAWFLTLAEEAEPELHGAQQERWLERLETEHDNFRGALAWALEGSEAELGLRLGGALGRFWLIRSYLSEGRRWLETALAGSSTSPASVRAKALSRAGSMALWQNDLEPAVVLLEESLTLFEELGDEPGVAGSLTDLGHAVLHQHDRGRLKALCTEAEALRRKSADRWAIAELLFFLGMVALYEGDAERSTAVLEEGLASFRELGDTGGVYACRTYLWMAALERGDRERAAALLEEDLRVLRSRLGTEPQLQVFDDLLGSAVVAALRGEAARAARLWGAAEALREIIGVPLPLWEHVPTDHERHLAVVRSQLEETAWEAAWSEGRTMTLEEAIEYALSEEEQPASSPKRPSLLSERELEILRLVAEGLTDSEVAQRLYLSPRTVGQHLRSIYRKLGVRTRAAAAKVAVERSLI